MALADTAHWLGRSFPFAVGGGPPRLCCRGSIVIGSIGWAVDPSRAWTAHSRPGAFQKRCTAGRLLTHSSLHLPRPPETSRCTLLDCHILQQRQGSLKEPTVGDPHNQSVRRSHCLGASQHRSLHPDQRSASARTGNGGLPQEGGGAPQRRRHTAQPLAGAQPRQALDLALLPRLLPHLDHLVPLHLGAL